jgi:protease-4
MKTFFASLLGTLTGLLVFALGGVVIVIAAIAAFTAAATREVPVTVETGAYLVLDLDANLTDAPPLFDGAELIGELTGEEQRKTWQLRSLTRALRAAKHDDRIAGVFLFGRFAPEGYGTGYAALKEARAALEDFKAAKKPVLAYLEFATIRELYFASVADDLALDPYGAVLMPGLATEPAFFAGAFEKYGVGVQITRVGKYKSAIEPFVRRDMSPESRQQMQKLLDDLWAELRSDVARARGLTPEKLQEIADREGLVMPESAVRQKLVTRLAYRDEIIAELKARTGRKNSKEAFRQIAFTDYAQTLGADRPGYPPDTASQATDIETPKPSGGVKGRIALVYAEGAIVDGEGGRDQIGGAKFARELRKLRQDDDVKAIVLRVNSPGGSATASEHIQRELRLAKETKPVVVSMGTYAASGGYWITAYSDRIFAEPTTITGSIGVFGVLFDVQQLAANFGVSFDRVKTGKFADAVTITRPKTPEELAIVQGMVDWIYEQFVGKVADARGLPRERVHEIAQGRVWSGAEAQKLGLVDELGGLDAAIVHAARRAKLAPDYAITEYPKKKDFAEMLADAFEKMQRPGGARASSGVVGQVVQKLESEWNTLGQFNDPRGIYARLPVELLVK